ncbi:uncharacterized protein LOC131626408 [Vicia villosa]|uniref:uncharacterized protein LOC131626408 n=1 Tax=Vicia villosa TaxID=3911 RepID=UPI00273B8B94|nr:uncharacterized protein LOC131626408 [Vicia villosa]
MEFLGVKHKGDVTEVVKRIEALDNQAVLRKEDWNDGEWIIGGDFNAIKDRSERKGRGAASNSQDVIGFADFIEESRLVDVLCKGKKFTWYCRDGRSMSRIDRFLVSEKVVNDWGVVGQMVGERDVSDHCPIWLEMDQNNWGPKPFKFNNEWFSCDSFYAFVEKEWKRFRVEGRGDYVLKQKLYLLKGSLKRWNKEVFSRLDLEIQDEVRDINNGDVLLEAEEKVINPEILFNRKEATSRFWTKLRIKENMLVQKANLKWLNEGDSNSGFFHKVMKEKRIFNHIGPFSTSEGMVESVKDIKDFVAHHFSKKFEEEEGVVPTLDGILFDKISDEDRIWLERPFQEEEINEALKCCGGAKSPGPGRQLLDGVLVANEVVDLARKEGMSCFLFKVDFEKAYDKISWEFLRGMLVKMGFGDKWRKWMELLVFKRDMSVVVNGSPSIEFVVKRGLRQGDSLSPFLFVLVAEALSRLVRKSIEIGEYKGLLLKRRCAVDILQFVDDTLLFGQGSWKHIKALKIVLRAFELVSGLGINFHKSKLIGINISSQFLEAASLYLSCKIEDSNFIFLGIPIGFNPRKEATWLPLLDKMRKRLKGWSHRYLNLGGRITLLKSILSSLTIFSMSFYMMPVKVGGIAIKDIKDFNFALLNKWKWRIAQGGGFLWHEVLKARYGDVSILDFTGGDSSKLTSSSFWWRDLLKVGFSSSFINEPFSSNCRFIVGNGFTTPFWEVAWLNNSILREDFLELFEISSLKKVSVAALGGWREEEWIWGDLGISGVEAEQAGLESKLAVLRSLLENFGGLKEDKDSVCWLLDSEKAFTVSSCYNRYASLRTPFGPIKRNEEALEIVWKMEVPYKIKAFAWMLFVNRLPTKDLLVYRESVTGLDYKIVKLKMDRELQFEAAIYYWICVKEKLAFVGKAGKMVKVFDEIWRKF